MNTTTLCSVSEKCGGCFYQHKDYLFQQRLKMEEVRKQCEQGIIKIPETIKFFSGSPYFYRNRMDFAFSEGGLGLRERGNYYHIVNFNNCNIANKEINEILNTINEWFNKEKDSIEIFDNLTRTGTLRYAIIRSSFFSKEASVTFILNKDSQKISEHSNLIKEFAHNCSINNILLGLVKHNTDVSVTNNYEVIKGIDILYEDLGDYKYYYHTQGFFQNNSEITLQMLTFIKRLIKDEYDVLVDLFGGVGTFGVFLSDNVKKVIIVDNNSNNIKCAFKNIKVNKKENIKIVQTNANNLNGLLIYLTDKKRIFIVDPPRTGLQKKTIRFFKIIRPQKIIYISCNISQLVNDIKKLHNLYTIHTMALFDMFPQTKHIECVMELILR